MAVGPWWPIKNATEVSSTGEVSSFNCVFLLVGDSLLSSEIEIEVMTNSWKNKIDCRRWKYWILKCRYQQRWFCPSRLKKYLAPHPLCPYTPRRQHCPLPSSGSRGRKLILSHSYLAPVFLSGVSCAPHRWQLFLPCVLSDLMWTSAIFLFVFGDVLLLVPSSPNLHETFEYAVESRVHCRLGVKWRCI